MQTRAVVPSGTNLSDEDETIFATEDELLDRGAVVVDNLKDLNPSEVE